MQVFLLTWYNLVLISIHYNYKLVCRGLWSDTDTWIVLTNDILEKSGLQTEQPVILETGHGMEL